METQTKGQKQVKNEVPELATIQKHKSSIMAQWEREHYATEVNKERDRLILALGNARFGKEYVSALYPNFYKHSGGK